MLKVQQRMASHDEEQNTGIAEAHVDERKLCIRCGTPLGADLRCPACFERDGAGGPEVNG